jgi:hypothetical protein
MLAMLFTNACTLVSDTCCLLTNACTLVSDTCCLLKNACTLVSDTCCLLTNACTLVLHTCCLFANASACSRNIILVYRYRLKEGCINNLVALSHAPLLRSVYTHTLVNQEYVFNIVDHRYTRCMINMHLEGS